MIDEKLQKETEKWLERATQERGKLHLNDRTKARFIKNIDAYISDSRTFMQSGQSIESFEAIIWAWAWIEILKELGVITAEY